MKNPKKIVDILEFIEEHMNDKQIEKFEKDSLRVGRRILEYLNSFDKPVFYIPGNWDMASGEKDIPALSDGRYKYLKGFMNYYLNGKSNKELLKGLKNVRDCQYKIHEYKGYNFIGYGLSSAPESVNPKYRKRKLTKLQIKSIQLYYDKILSKLNKEYSKRNKKFPTIFLSHNVPYGCKLDIFKQKKSEYNGEHFGSNIARDFCVKNKPLLCFSGHMHENFGKDKIGKTTVINTGFGSYINTFVTLNKDKIKKIEFWDPRGKYKKK